MNRRTLIKNILLLGAFGVTSASLFKWFQTTKQPVPDSLDNYELTISELAETIIPRTDTPGAKDVRVEIYIINILENCTDIKTRNNFLKGLESLESYVFDQYNRKLSQCTMAEKIEVLIHFEKKSSYSYHILNKINAKLFGTPFFIKLRELTVEGYCTSKTGATKGLAYDYIPGNYEACVPLYKHQRSWATK